MTNRVLLQINTTQPQATSAWGCFWFGTVGIGKEGFAKIAMTELTHKGQKAAIGLLCLTKDSSELTKRRAYHVRN